MARARWTTNAMMLVLWLMPLPASAARPEIGGAVAVKNEVTAEDGDATRKLTKGGKVFQNDILATSKSASAQIEFLDKTKLAVGPSARIVLDKFIYDANAAPGSISINLAKGAFRFITGASPKAAYEIKTPTASMGVRGTVFDVYVADDGDTVVLLHEGGVDICSTPTTCQRHDKIGHIVHIGLDRVISAPLRWDGTLMKGLAVTTAFPFVGKKLVIDPVRRLTYGGILKGGTGRVIDAPARTLRNLGRGLRSPF
jgi:FecR protein